MLKGKKTLLRSIAFRLRNIRRVYLSVNGNNSRAIQAYKACGFIEEGRLRAHVWNDGKFVDLVFMGLFQDEWNKLQAQASSE